MLTQSVIITIIGMTLVFAFLAFLVLCVDIAAYFVKVSQKYFPEPQEEGSKPQSGFAADKIALAIAAARSRMQ